MKYRKLGKTGIEVSSLGFGMMRPPRDENNQVDEKLFIKMVQYAIESGINYIDTAYTYIDGKSESITKKALQGRYRDKVYVTTKCPVWLCKTSSDFDRILDEQLRRLGFDAIDFYFLHGIERAYWEKHVLPLDLLFKLEQAKKAGKILHAGFSFHDNFDLFKSVIGATDIWELVQIQLNYYDSNYQAGIQGLQYAARKGLGVSIMEPLRGGFLANVPPEIKTIFERGEKQKSPVEWAFDYLWNMPEVSLILSGMSSMQMVEENIQYAGRAYPGMLDSDEQKILTEAAQQFHSYDIIPCTGCSYCSICPRGVAIPKCFELFNQMKILNTKNIELRNYYDEYVTTWGNKASSCIACRACEKVCPQHIKISDQLKLVAAAFE